jgi:Ice-binding-like
VSLGTAADFAVLGASTVTNTGPTVLIGSLGLYPGTSVTGFLPGVIEDGSLYIADAAALQAQNDLTAAFNALSSLAPTEILTGENLGGLLLTSGVYFYASSAQLTGTLVLDAQGISGAIFVFQIGSTLTTASGSAVVLINSGASCDVYWVIGTSATIGTGTAFVGNVLAAASITSNNLATVDGRLLAMTGAVTLDDNAVSNATCITCAPAPPPLSFSHVDQPLSWLDYISLMTGARETPAATSGTDLLILGSFVTLAYLGATLLVTWWAVAC